jgi:hypothetical protein
VARITIELFGSWAFNIATGMILLSLKIKKKQGDGWLSREMGS